VFQALCSIDNQCDATRDAIEAVIHGGARGVDSYANEWALEYGVPVSVFLADWSTRGRAAGPIRNQRMLEDGRPSHFAAFWDGESAGTLDMIRRCVKAGIIGWVVAP
jgi:hypothetical protein